MVNSLDLVFMFITLSYALTAGVTLWVSVFSFYAWMVTGLWWLIIPSIIFLLIVFYIIGHFYNTVKGSDMDEIKND